jgi:hypothetical protein
LRADHKAQFETDDHLTDDEATVVLSKLAAYCLHLNAPLTDTDADLIEHEMALEWLTLADAALGKAAMVSETMFTSQKVQRRRLDPGAPC